MRIVDVDADREDGDRQRRQRHAATTRCCSRPAAARGCRRSRASTRTASSPSARSTTRARCSSAPAPGVKAVVIGGGLLGLEAARGLQVQGCDVTVVHLMPTLMERQLDPDGGDYLRRQDGGARRPACCSAARPRRSSATATSKAWRFADGSVLEADLVVVAAGIRPNVELGRKAGLHGQPRHRRQRPHGDVAIPTSSPSASASSTTASATAWWRRCSSRARCWPRRSPATRARPTRARCRRPSSRSWASTCSPPATGASRSAEPVRYEDRALGIYKKLTVRDGKLAGVDPRRRHVRQPPLHGVAAQRRRPDRAAAASAVSAAGGRRRPRRRGDGRQRHRLRLRRRHQGRDHRGHSRPGRQHAVAAQGVHARQHRLRQLHERCARNCCARSRRSSRTRGKKVICGCLPFAEDKLREILRSQQLKSVQEVLDIYGNGIGCEVCKPALSYMLDMLWCGDHDEDRSARFINDRVHANIQKDGTFSVIPRIRGGVTTPDELRRIADVADKYQVPMVKITGSQRIDLLGIKKADLPKVWADLGHAVRAGVHQGRAHGEDLRRHRVLPVRHAGLDRRRHRDGAALREAVHAAQGEDGRGRLSAQLRRGHGQGHRPRRPGRRLAGGRRRRRRQERAQGRSADHGRDHRSRRSRRRSSSSSTTARTPTTSSAPTTSSSGSASRRSARRRSTRPTACAQALLDRLRKSKARVARCVARRARRRSTRRSSFRFEPLETGACA